MPYTLFDHKNPTTYPPIELPVLVYYYLHNSGRPILNQAVASRNEPHEWEDLNTFKTFSPEGAQGFDVETDFTPKDVLAWELLPSIPEEIQALFEKRVKEKTQ